VIDISGMQEVSIDFHVNEATVAAGATASEYFDMISVYRCA
jgi:hypothetical protein